MENFSASSWDSLAYTLACSDIRLGGGNRFAYTFIYIYIYMYICMLQ